MNQYTWTSILSPIRRLPLEIVGEIFLYFVPSFQCHSDFRIQEAQTWIQEAHSRVKFPWKLGHICRLWRTIALSLGQLWSVLDVAPQSSRSILSRCRAPRLVGDGEHIQEDEFTHWPPRSDAGNQEFEEALEIEATIVFINGCVQRSGNRPLSIRFHTPNLRLLSSSTSC
ncbi:hypothetical protein DFH09DRAFT_1046092 [Mycena vulgaris]|nr:hypothetical protein DFH09DRAFT_1046092 [Mycena vulgaris]